ncbi:MULTISPECIES: LPXTG cell wall anchor domain-containing protein [unclassified Staphylococcus]|nr:MULTISPECIES: LPXTG cell wall anchor domain-containing protein [unclassified Staphylococcus]
MEQQNLPDTGQQNNAEILSISAGLLALTAGLSLLMFKNRFVNKSK